MSAPGILASVYGGLGNQMFMVAAGHVISSRLHCPLYIEIQENSHNVLRRDYKTCIFKCFGVPETCDRVGYSMGSNSGFMKWDPNNIPIKTILDSYFQYYPPFASWENELRGRFIQGLDEFRRCHIESFPNLDKSAFLHVRRGDYLKLPAFHYIQTPEYYEAATARLLSMDPSIETIYVVSDDMEWARGQKMFQTPKHAFYDGGELETLALMSLCLKGAICANSTFSWWGAYLGAYAHRSPVIVPGKWIAVHVENLFPTEWIIL